MELKSERSFKQRTAQNAPEPCLPCSGFTLRAQIFQGKVSDGVMRQLLRDIKNKRWSLIVPSPVLPCSDKDLCWGLAVLETLSSLGADAWQLLQTAWPRRQAWDKNGGMSLRSWLSLLTPQNGHFRLQMARAGTVWVYWKIQWQTVTVSVKCLFHTNLSVKGHWKEHSGRDQHSVSLDLGRSQKGGYGLWACRISSQKHKY